MAISLLQKLRIKESTSLLTINAPKDFEAQLEPLPAGVSISTKAKKYDQLHWFVTNKSQMESELDKVLSLVKEDVLCWIYYPKGTSKIQTDLTRDKGWEKLLAQQDWQYLSLISFNDTWSTWGFRLKTEKDKKKEVKPVEREILNYLDSDKKQVRLPEDLAAALKENASATKFYNDLSFTNKKEYVEWIVTAKREETRKQRVEGTIERLEKGWKNPRNI